MLDIAYTDPIKFSYWAPLGSGGFVVSNIEQHTEFNLEANVRYIREAERTGLRLRADARPLLRQPRLAVAVRGDDHGGGAEPAHGSDHDPVGAYIPVSGIPGSSPRWARRSITCPEGAGG